jgi:hypothetical protein
MKIFFAEADPEQYTHSETDEMFEDPNTGSHYFYMIDTDEDNCVRIWDTCGRMIPFDVEQLESLCEATYALQELVNLRATVEERVRDNMEEVINTTHQYTGVRVLV